MATTTLPYFLSSLGPSTVDSPTSPPPFSALPSLRTPASASRIRKFFKYHNVVLHRGVKLPILRLQSFSLFGFPTNLNDTGVEIFIFFFFSSSPSVLKIWTCTSFKSPIVLGSIAILVDNYSRFFSLVKSSKGR